jgi:aerobic carbon-monoxide dehydrogenase small subunit
MYKATADTLTTVALHVNGRAYRSAVEPRMLLSDFLRDACGLTGTHVGCEHGVCGSCTVLIDGEAVRSCLLLAIAAQDCEILSIEGIAQHPAFPAVYHAFTEHHALQCGFCTPGIVASTFAEVVGKSRSEEQIVDLLSGHLCRCTGYTGIKDAMSELTQATVVREQEQQS